LLIGAGIDDDLILVGWSAGGVYIREYHRQYPEKIKALLFVDSSHEQQANRLPQSSDSGNGNDAALRIGKYLAPLGLIRLSGAVDRRVEASSGSDELKARLKAIYHQSHTLSAVLKESDAFNFDIASTQPPASLGDLPLNVLTRGKPLEARETTSPNNSFKFQQECGKLGMNSNRN